MTSRLVQVGWDADWLIGEKASDGPGKYGNEGVDDDEH